MADLTKTQYRIAKDILKIGILRRHEQWQEELSELLRRPYDDEIGNAYDRSMAITRMSHDWFKEANKMESWYSSKPVQLHCHSDNPHRVCMQGTRSWRSDGRHRK